MPNLYGASKRRTLLVIAVLTLEMRFRPAYLILFLIRNIIETADSYKTVNKLRASDKVANKNERSFCFFLESAYLTDKNQQLINNGDIDMELIPSFSVDHTKIIPGIFLSRQDKVGDAIVTTYDIRLSRPNREPAVDVGAMHSLEHIIATFLRNNPEWKNEIIYWGV